MRGGGGVHFTHPGGISRNVSSKARAKLCFFVTFDIIANHIFPENLIDIPQVVLKIWRHSLSISAIFVNFYQFFMIFWHFVITKKQTTSAYNKWCQHFLTFKIFLMEDYQLLFRIFDDMLKIILNIWYRIWPIR